MTDKPIDSFKQEVEAQKQHEFDSKLKKIEQERDRFKNRYNDLLSDYDIFKSQSEWLDTLSQKFVPPASIQPESKTGTGEAVACMVGSDWHVFETILAERVNGLNFHNPDIAEKSVQKFFDGGLAWANIHRSRLKINKLVLALLGDHITNMLYEDQKEENFGPVQEEVLFVLNLTCQGIDMLVENGGFNEILVVCCPGNHAREAMEKRVSGSAQHTYEWLMFKFMQDFIYKDHKIVKFQIAEGYHNFVEVYGKWLRFHHGDWIRYMGGVGGLTIPMNKAIKSWNTARKADWDIFGHWHQTIDEPLFYSNGCTLGYSPYAVKVKGEFERPQQGFITFDSKRFVTSVDRIYVR